MLRIVPVWILAFMVAGCSMGDGFRRACRWVANPVGGSSADSDAAEAFDADDADARREGIIKLTKRRGGLKGKYLKAYAVLCEDPDPLVRGAAVNALGRAGDPAYLDAVVARLDDDALLVRLDAAEALDNIHGDAAIDSLTKVALSDDEADMRMRCMRALRHYRKRPVLDVLVRGLDDGEFGVRFAARNALRELTGQDHRYDVGQWRKAIRDAADPFIAVDEPGKSWLGRLFD